MYSETVVFLIPDCDEDRSRDSFIVILGNMCLYAGRMRFKWANASPGAPIEGS